MATVLLFPMPSNTLFEPIRSQTDPATFGPHLKRRDFTWRNLLPGDPNLNHVALVVDPVDPKTGKAFNRLRFQFPAP